jgi:integrase
VFYRVGRTQRVKTFRGPNTQTVATKWKAREVDGKGTSERTDPALGRITLGDVYDEQLSARSFAPKTLTIRKQVRRMPGLQPLFDMKLNAITRSGINEAIAATTSAPGMAREIRKSLSSALTFAVEVKGVDFPKGNPARSSGMRSTVAERAANGDGSEEPEYIPSREEVDRLIEGMPDRYKVFIEMLARVGMRWHSEGASLRVGDFDPLQGELKLYAPKTGKTRIVPLSRDLVDKLAAHIERYGSWDPDALIFTTESGGRIDEHNWRRRVFKKAAERAGITYPKFRPYDLRHYACSAALELGVSETVVANMSGHSVDMLRRVYAHAMGEAKKRAAEVLGDAWTRGGSTEGQVVPIRS